VRACVCACVRACVCSVRASQLSALSLSRWHIAMSAAGYHICFH